MVRVRSFWLASIALAVALIVRPGAAQKKYDPGASDTEIKIGNIMPYSGPQSIYAQVGRTEAAFFKMINDRGGINGRKINFISYDDSFAPPKTVERFFEFSLLGMLASGYFAVSLQRTEPPLAAIIPSRAIGFGSPAFG